MTENPMSKLHDALTQAWHAGRSPELLVVWPEGYLTSDTWTSDTWGSVFAQEGSVLVHERLWREVVRDLFKAYECREPKDWEVEMRMRGEARYMGLPVDTSRLPPFEQTEVGRYAATEVMPVAEHEAEVERLRAACRHVVSNCYCQPSGQTCDVCRPAALALLKEAPDASQSETSLITDEMVDRASIRFWHENAHDKSLTLHEQSRRAMRVALEEVAGEIIEAFGANGDA